MAQIRYQQSLTSVPETGSGALSISSSWRRLVLLQKVKKVLVTSDLLRHGPIQEGI